MDAERREELLKELRSLRKRTCDIEDLHIGPLRRELKGFRALVKPREDRMAELQDSLLENRRKIERLEDVLGVENEPT